MEQTRSGEWFGYVQNDIEVPEELKKKSANFPPNFKNTNVCRHDIGLLMKDYPERESTFMFTTQNVDFKLFHGKRYTHYSSAPILFKFGTSMQKNYRFVGNFPVKCLKNLRKLLSMPVEKDKLKYCREGMKMLANSSDG